MKLPSEITLHMTAHARWAGPIEACGLLAMSEGTVRFFYACTNVAEAPDRFIVSAPEHFRALQHAEAHGWEIGGSFHSHPNGTLAPSPLDVRSALDPRWVYFIGSTDDVRAYRIADGLVDELSLSH